MDQVYDVVIVGCGVFGLSSALELVNKGYKVLAVDAYPVPSALSAANDYNKILRIEYSDEISAGLAVEALNLWEQHELYKPSFIKTGRLTLSPSDSKSTRSKYELKSFEILEKLGVKQNIMKLTSPKDVAKQIPEFKDNNLPESFTSSYNTDCGTGLSSNALKDVYLEAKKRGVEFAFGDDGKVTKILNNQVQVKSTKTYTGKKILVTAGAGTGLIVPLDNQTKVFGAFVTHIKLTPEEFEKYKRIPIFFSAEHGYFFPPDKDTRHVKIGVTTCDAYSEINHPFELGKKLRAPRYTIDHPSETLPRGHAEDVRKLLHLVVPELSNHQLVDCKTCWVADTCDSYFLIDKCPYYENVYVATGDSSHSFKFLPNIGKYITQRIEGTLDQKYADKWKWRNNPSFENGENAKSRYPRPHYDLRNTSFISLSKL